MLQNHVNQYLSQNNYQLQAESPVFTELESMHFVGLIAHLSNFGIDVDLSLFDLDLNATLSEFISWLGQFVKVEA